MPVTLTRVRLPQRRKDFLRRVRLLDALHRNLQRKLIFISAPAGYGKTSLLLDFAADVDATVCWYSIAPDHVDLTAFVEHFIAAFQQRFPLFGGDVAEALRAPGAAPDPYSLASELTNEMAVQIDDFCVLMLDDFHLVGETAAITDFVEALLEQLPEQVRVIIAGRSVYGIPAANLYVHGDLGTIGAKDLRFRAEELQALVRQNYRVTLPPEQALHLAKLSDGWIMAILLASRALERGEFPQLKGEIDQLYKFLAEEVLSQQPPLLQTLLLTTAIVDDFDQGLCNYLLETDSTVELLNELIGRNLFVSQIESGETVSYHYHQLFAEFLRDQLWATDPARAKALHRRAADWFARREAWELAVRHLLAAEDREAAARLMDRVALALYAAGRIHALGKWFEALSAPPELLAHAPRLVLSQAKTLIDQGTLKDCEWLLDIAERALRDQGDIDQVANALLTRGMIRRFQGKFDEALALAQEVQSLLEEGSYRWYAAQRLWGLSLGQMGQPDQAIACLKTAVAGFRRLESPHDLAETLNDLGIIQYERGDMLEAQAHLQEVLTIRRKLGHSGALALALNNAGYLYYQAGRYRQAWQAYDEALQSARSTQFVRTASHILNGQGDLLRDLDEWELAAQAYEAAREINDANDDQSTAVYTYSGLAELERLRGNFNEAFHWLREAARCRKDTVESPAYQVGLGSIYLEIGQFGLVERVLTQALAAWQGLSRPRQEQALTEFLLARARFENGQAEASLDALAQAMQHTAQLGYDQFLVTAGRRAGKLLEYATGAWPQQPQLRSLVQRVSQFQTGLAHLQREAAPAEAARPLRLEWFGFNSGRVRRDGELIPPSTWISGQSRALFFFVVDRGQTSKEEIALNLWPDISPEKFNSNFHTTLWRVRRAIGREVLVFEEERYCLAPSLNVWYDVAEFEAYLKQAADDRLSPDERAEVWRQALALYQGDYLNDMSLEWVDRRRSELQKQYLLILMRLADWEYRRHRYGEAKDLYEKVIALDPYQDDAHIGVLECLLQNGALLAAQSHFLTYKKLLKNELGIPPSLPLQALYDRISREAKT